MVTPRSNYFINLGWIVFFMAIPAPKNHKLSKCTPTSARVWMKQFNTWTVLLTLRNTRKKQQGSISAPLSSKSMYTLSSPLSMGITQDSTQTKSNNSLQKCFESWAAHLSMPYMYFCLITPTEQSRSPATVPNKNRPKVKKMPKNKK